MEQQNQISPIRTIRDWHERVKPIAEQLGIKFWTVSVNSSIDGEPEFSYQIWIGSPISKHFTASSPEITLVLLREYTSAKSNDIVIVEEKNQVYQEVYQQEQNDSDVDLDQMPNQSNLLQDENDIPF